MKQPFAEFEEFRALLDALCEESITPEQMRRLEELILTRPEAEAYYVQFMSLQAGLHKHFGVPAERVERAVRERVTAGARAKRQARWAIWGFVGAAAAVILIAFLLKSGQENGKEVAGPQEPTDDSVAVLLQASGAAWEGLALRTGAPLLPGTYVLKSGHAQIEFYSGARVILEGPAEFELISRTEAFCKRGKLRAIVPTMAQGFTIITPTMNLVDRGTEFGVEVGGNQKTEVHVFQGKVELFDPTSEKPLPRKELTTGQGVSFDAGGKLNTIKVKPERFLTAEGAERRAEEFLRQQQKNWAAASEELKADPSLLVYYTFLKDWPGSRTLLNRSRTTSDRNGAIVGCSWGQGRWPEKNGLEFKRVSDRVRLQVPGEFTSATLIAWVRVDSLPNQNNALFMSDGWEPGEMHWQIGQDGKLILGVQCDPKGKGSHYHAPNVMTPGRFGQWIHLAVVYDGERGEVLHFVDGKIAASEPVQIDGPLHVGDAELGNWNVATHRNSTPIRNLNGCMDEFMLFSRALGAEEVEKLYLSGRPPL